MPFTYSLHDLQTHDSNPKGNARERLFKCPVCGSSERSLHLNTQSGFWNCKRASCGAKGRLSDFSTPYQPQPPRMRVKAVLERTFALPVPQLTSDSTQSENWRIQWHDSACISESSRGTKALEARRLNLETAVAAGVRFCSNWSPSVEGRAYNGGPAILYPLHDAQGQLQAVAGRYLQPQPNGPKVRTGGRLSQGAFFAPVDGLSPLGRDNPTIVLVEGPACALSLALCGLPTLALGGCALPRFLPLKCGLREVAIASDCDEAGDNAALDWKRQLERLGARCSRLRADDLAQGVKDWNEALQVVGEQKLREFLELKLKLLPSKLLPSKLLPSKLLPSKLLPSKQTDEIASLYQLLNSHIETGELDPLIATTTDEVYRKWLGLEEENPADVHLEVLKIICFRQEIEFP